MPVIIDFLFNEIARTHKKPDIQCWSKEMHTYNIRSSLNFCGLLGTGWPTLNIVQHFGPHELVNKSMFEGGHAESALNRLVSPSLCLWHAKDENNIFNGPPEPSLGTPILTKYNVTWCKMPDMISSKRTTIIITEGTINHCGGWGGGKREIILSDLPLKKKKQKSRGQEKNQQTILWARKIIKIASVIWPQKKNPATMYPRKNRREMKISPRGPHDD